jgi:hypothetical protein
MMNRDVPVLLLLILLSPIVSSVQKDANGKDVEFINEYQQNIGDKNRFYSTGGNEISLPAGTYSVYIIAWGKREVMEHRGNLTEYFAKMTLAVK